MGDSEVSHGSYISSEAFGITQPLTLELMPETRCLMTRHQYGGPTSELLVFVTSVSHDGHHAHC